MLQVKLVQHTYSCLYGTFLGNSPCEREMHNIYKRTCSVWSLLRAGNKNFHNLLYMPGSEQVSRAPGLVFWALCLPGTGDCIKRDWRGFLLCSSLNIAIVAGAASSVPCPSTARLDSSLSPSFLPTSSGTGWYGHLPAPWISEPGVQWQMFGQVRAWSSSPRLPPTHSHLPLLAHYSFSVLPVVLIIFAVESKSSVALSQPLGEEHV